MSPATGDDPGTVGRPAPILPAILLLLALLGPQEEQPVDWQQDPAGQYLVTISHSESEAGLLDCRTVIILIAGTLGHWDRLPPARKLHCLHLAVFFPDILKELEK